MSENHSTDMRTCTKCGLSKRLDAATFRQDSRRLGCPGEFSTICRECNSLTQRMRNKTPEGAAKAAEYRQQNRRLYNASNRRYRATHQPDIAVRQRIKRDAEKQKYHAWNAISTAVRYGDMEPLPCFVCGNALTVGHHPDYDAPLDVVWLCRLHHAQLHKEHAAAIRAQP